jgi:ABC-type Fe3+-citrate transport system substrate-binding protein
MKLADLKPRTVLLMDAAGKREKQRQVMRLWRKGMSAEKREQVRQSDRERKRLERRLMRDALMKQVFDFKPSELFRIP